MKLRTKILAGFLIMALVAVIIGVAGLISTSALKSITNELNELQEENDSVTKVLNAHYVWRQALTESVLTGSEFTGSLDPNTCALGLWHESDQAKKMSDPRLLNDLKQLDAPHEYIHTEAKIIVSLIKEGRMNEASNFLENDIFPKTAEVISILADMQSRYNDLVKDKEADSIRIAGLVDVVNIVLIIVALGICVFLALYISGMISKPLVKFTAFLQRAGSTGDITIYPDDEEVIRKYSKNKDEIGAMISGCASFVGHVVNIATELEIVASGDLTVEVELLSQSDTMGKSLSQVVDNLNHLFGGINSSANQVSAGSKHVADGSQALAQGATQQAASIEELSDSVAEVAERTKTNAGMAKEAAKLSDTIRGDAEEGSRQMDDMITAVKEINDASQSISKIIKTIDDIAFQTNILALNAAVEAARAGQHGKGFAVVAEEVRNLASKSAEAAKDTGNMIQNSMEKAELGSRIAGETAASLTKIATGINESSQLVVEIAKASEEQSMRITQINTGIDQVAQVVQQNSATAEESAAASEEMSSQSTILQEMISQFKFRSGSTRPGLPAGSISTKRPLPVHEETNYAAIGGKDFGKY